MPNDNAKPRMFVASSVEGLEIAHALQEILKHDADVTVWPQGTFGPSQYPLESLTAALDGSDFGMFVFSADDVVMMRDRTMPVVRDNVILELGLFIGRLGRERNFFISPRDAHDLHLPSDLSGLTPVRFDANRSDKNLLAAIGAETFGIKQVMKKLGRVVSSAPGAAPAEKTISLEVDSKECELLAMLASARPGMLQRVPFDGGMEIMVNSTSLEVSNDPKEAAKWRGAIDRLVGWGLLETYHNDRDMFQLSERGFHYAEQLERLTTNFEPQLKDYTRDTFLDILWRWKWKNRASTGDSVPLDIKPYCPKCDLELSYDRGFVNLGPGPGKADEWICTACQTKWPGVSEKEAEKRIMAKIRSGDWKSSNSIAPAKR